MFWHESGQKGADPGLFISSERDRSVTFPLMSQRTLQHTHCSANTLLEYKSKPQLRPQDLVETGLVVFESSCK